MMGVGVSLYVARKTSNVFVVYVLVNMARLCAVTVSSGAAELHEERKGGIR